MWISLLLLSQLTQRSLTVLANRVHTKIGVPTMARQRRRHTSASLSNRPASKWMNWWLCRAWKAIKTAGPAQGRTRNASAPFDSGWQSWFEKARRLFSFAYIVVVILLVVPQPPWAVCPCHDIDFSHQSHRRGSLSVRTVFTSTSLD